MDSQKKRVATEATHKNAATSDSCDFITILDSAHRMADFHHADGSVDSRDTTDDLTDIRETRVSNLADAASVFLGLNDKVYSCVVRGRNDGEKFVDAPNQLLILHVKGYQAVATDPELAVREFIDLQLPACFQGAQFFWRLDPKSRRKASLSVYVGFWLDTPRTLAQMRRWAGSLSSSLLIAKDSFSPSAPIFTADPIFESGSGEAIPAGYCKDGIESLTLAGVDDENDQGFDTITLLETLGPFLTKIYKADGTTDSYDDAANYKVKEVEVNSIHEWSARAKKLEGMPKICQIHGKFVGKERAAKGPYENAYPRTNANFDDQEQHLLVIDIDGYRPEMIDPVTETEDAVKLFIATILPVCFRDVSFHWHLSSSAGMPGKEDILKCHLWMWLKTPYTCAQLYEWAKVIGPMIDKAVYRRVQIRYVANPIFEEGRIDPVPQRSGFYQGASDEVDLVIDAGLLALAREQGAGEGGNDMKLVDPSEKDGLIGLFHRTYSAEQVLLEILDGEFEQVTDRRYTWHNGGGTPEGVWVHDDGLHVGSSHNTWPISGIANLWDLVRVFKFDQLDTSEDAFEQMDMESRGIGGLPSNQAMIAFAEGLPEIVAAQKAEGEQEAIGRQSVVDGLVADINAALKIYTLEKVLAPRIVKADLSLAERTGVAKVMQDQFKKLGSPMTKSDVTKMLAAPRGRTTSDSAPDWSGCWVWVTSSDKFMNTETKTAISAVSYNAKYDRHMVSFADENGVVPKAMDMALKVWNTKVVDHAVYMPTAGLFFTLNRVSCVNTYRTDLFPDEPGELTKKQRAAIDVVERHIRFLCGDRDWLADTLLDWLAHNVQFPGVKIRFSPLIQGIPGDGKSFVGKLMAYTMGQPNVSIISAQSVNSNFSAWAQGCCLGVMEEIRMQGNNRFEALNALKELITNDTIAVIGKGRDQINVPNTINYLATTNFRDALPLEDGDRRWLVIFTQWKNIAEFESKVGISYEKYFECLSDAMENHAGALRQWLRTRAISKRFNRHGRAPETAEKKTMVSLGRFSIDVLAENIIAETGYGIYPEVLSSGHLTAAMEGNPGVTPPRGAAVNSMLDRMGYIQFHKVIKWNGMSIRPWSRRAVTDQKEIQEMMDAAEADRQASDEAKRAQDVEKEFND